MSVSKPIPSTNLNPVHIHNTLPLHQPRRKSRSHKMYAWSNDNDTETELTPAELGQYEYASSVKTDATTSLPETNQPPMMDSRQYQSVVSDAQHAAQVALENSNDTQMIESKTQESTGAHPSPLTESGRSVESYGSDLVRIMAEDDGRILSEDGPGSGPPASPLTSSSPVMDIFSAVKSPRPDTHLLTPVEIANPARIDSLKV